jgi:hypothetical protein
MNVAWGSIRHWRGEPQVVGWLTRRCSSTRRQTTLSEASPRLLCRESTLCSTRRYQRASYRTARSDGSDTERLERASTRIGGVLLVETRTRIRYRACNPSREFLIPENLDRILTAPGPIEI